VYSTLFLAELALEPLPGEFVFLRVTVEIEDFFTSSPIFKSTTDEALELERLPVLGLKGLKKLKEPFLETSVIPAKNELLFLVTRFFPRQGGESR
jgi:hypothetical protein